MKPSWGGRHHFQRYMKAIAAEKAKQMGNYDKSAKNMLNSEQYAEDQKEEMDADYVGMLSNYLGLIYKNYGNDPHSKILLLMCSFLMCGQS